MIARTLFLVAATSVVLGAQSAPGNAVRKAQATAGAANARTRGVNEAQKAMVAPPKPAATTPAVVPPTTTPGAVVKPDSQLTLMREVFVYETAGRRDPFASLIQSGELRPLLQDLRIVAIAYDPTGRNSVAVMRDVSTTKREQYRVKVGQTIGRMRVAQIQLKSVVFAIEEYGFSRQEVLTIGDTSKVRTP